MPDWLTWRMGWVFWVASIPLVVYMPYNDALYVRLSWAFCTGFAVWLFVFGKQP